MRRRLGYAGAALAAAAVGAALVFACLVASDDVPEATLAIPMVALATLLGVGLLVGKASVPARVLEHGTEGRFVAGVALVVVALPLLYPSGLICFTLPVALSAGVAGVALLRTALKHER